MAAGCSSNVEIHNDDRVPITLDIKLSDGSHSWHVELAPGEERTIHVHPEADSHLVIRGEGMRPQRFGYFTGGMGYDTCVSVQHHEASTCTYQGESGTHELVSASGPEPL